MLRIVVWKLQDQADVWMKIEVLSLVLKIEYRGGYRVSAMGGGRGLGGVKMYNKVNNWKKYKKITKLPYNFRMECRILDFL